MVLNKKGVDKEEERERELKMDWKDKDNSMNQWRRNEWGGVGQESITIYPVIWIFNSMEGALHWINSFPFIDSLK